jgi:hypothetical protein
LLLFLPLRLFLLLFFSCHPSPQAEDLLLPLPLPSPFSSVIPKRSEGICFLSSPSLPATTDAPSFAHFAKGGM